MRTPVTSLGASRRRRSFSWSPVHQQGLGPSCSAATRTNNVRFTPSRYVQGLNQALQSRYGAGHATFPPSKERRPGLLHALFTRVRGICHSRKFAFCYSMLLTLPD